MTTLPEPPRSPLVEARTGLLSREWVRFFDELRRAIVSQLDDAVGSRLEALEADALFGDAGGAGAGSGGYNDFAVRDRLDALETELAFPAPPAGGASDPEALAELVAAAEALAGQAVLEGAFPAPADAQAARRLAALETQAALAPEDPGPALQSLARRVAALEAGLATIPDPVPALQSLARRVADLETEGPFT